MVSRRWVLGGLLASGAGIANAAPFDRALIPPPRPGGGAKRAVPDAGDLINAANLSGDTAFVVADARTGAVLEAVNGAQKMPPASTAKELNAKFAASGGTFTFTYGDVTMFFAGLEGLLGSPSPEVMPTMTLEHASTEPFKAWNSDVERLTTPKAEWAYVTEGTAGTADSAEKEAGGPRRPSHISDGSGERKGWKLEDFAKQPQIKKAELLLAEVAGLRSYTCAAAIRIGPVCPTSHMHPPDARRRAQGPNVRAL